MQKPTFYITGNDGHSMPVYSWLPAQETTAIVVIAHGLAEHAQRYAPIAKALNAEGLSIFGFDERGHGNAVSSNADLGYAPGNWFNKQIEDIDLLLTHIRSKYPGKNIFLFGHSMGSFIAQRFFQLHGKSIDGLILSATNGEADPLLNLGIAVAWLQAKLFGAAHKSKIIDRLSFGRFNAAFKPNRTAHDWLSRDEEEVDKYVQDPKCGFICSASFFYYFFKGIRDVMNHQNFKKIPVDVPVYAFAGDRDPVGLEGKGFLKLMSKWKAAGVRDISYQLYKEGRHEMLNEINREEVLANLVSWIRSHS